LTVADAQLRHAHDSVGYFGGSTSCCLHPSPNCATALQLGLWHLRSQSGRRILGCMAPAECND
jgi:hypothetical protein